MAEDNKLSLIEQLLAGEDVQRLPVAANVRDRELSPELRTNFGKTGSLNINNAIFDDMMSKFPVGSLDSHGSPTLDRIQRLVNVLAERQRR